MWGIVPNEPGTTALMLTGDETARRIKAARLLRGLTQDELAKRVAEAGLPWRLVGSLERGEQPMRSAHRAALSEALGFPERWFIVAVDDLCSEEVPEEVLARLDRIERLLGEK